MPRKPDQKFSDDELTLIHSDVRLLLPLVKESERMADREGMLSAMLEQIVNRFGSNIILPTYNYKFPETKEFDVSQTPSEVGALTDFARQQPGWLREPTPIFSHCAKEFGLPFVRNPFGSESIFQRLVKQRGRIALLGVGVESLTFIHNSEFHSNAPYRYVKKFDGFVVSADSKVKRTIEFLVRPPGSLVVYDFDKISGHFIEKGLSTQPHPRITLLEASGAHEELLNKLDKNPFWLLTSVSADRCRNRLDALGRPFNIDDFEK